MGRRSVAGNSAPTRAQGSEGTRHGRGESNARLGLHLNSNARQTTEIGKDETAAVETSKVESGEHAKRHRVKRWNL